MYIYTRKMHAVRRYGPPNLPQFGTSVNNSPTAVDESGKFSLVTMQRRNVGLRPNNWLLLNTTEQQSWEIFKPFYVFPHVRHAHHAVYSLNATHSFCQVAGLYSLKRKAKERESYLFICCDVMCGESDTLVIYLDSFTVQQRPFYYVSLLSAS